MKNFLLAFALLMVSILFFQNLEKGTVNVLFWQFEFSIGFWILSAFLSGLFIGYLLGFFKKGADSPEEELDAKHSDLEDEDDEFLKP